MAEIFDCCAIVVLPAVESDVIDFVSICVVKLCNCSSSRAIRPRSAASFVAERRGLMDWPPTDLLVGFGIVTFSFENRGTDHALDSLE